MEELADVAVVVDEKSVKPPLESALEENAIAVVHARDPREAVHVVRALGVRCMVVLGRVGTLRARLELLVRLRAEHPNCAAKHPVVVTEPKGSDVPDEAPCLVAKTDARDAGLLRHFFARLLVTLRWRAAA